MKGISILINYNINLLLKYLKYYNKIVLIIYWSIDIIYNNSEYT